MHTSAPRPALISLTLCLCLLLAACGNDDDADAPPEPETDQQTTAPQEGLDEDPAREDAADSTGEPFAEADLLDAAGNDVGQISLAEAEEDAGVQVRIEAWGLGPGFRGISIHEHGVCEVQSTDEWGQIGDFYSAGGTLEGTAVQQTDVVDGEEELADEPTPGAEAEAEGEAAHPDRAGSLPNLLINEDESGYLEVVTDRLSEELLLEGEGRAVIIHSAPDHHGNVPERYAPYGTDAQSQTTGDTGDRVACGVVD